MKKTISRIPIIVVGIFFLQLLMAQAIVAQGPARLNILLFTADDLHHESVGAFAGRPKGLTPHLDGFARQGMRFDRAHVNAAICAPSRAVIATGLYSHRSGAMGFMKAREGTPDMVTTFQKAGYLWCSSCLSIHAGRAHGAPRVVSTVQYA